MGYTMTDLKYHMTTKTHTLADGTERVYTQYRPYTPNTDKKDSRASRTIIKNKIRRILVKCTDINKLNAVLELIK